MPKLFHFLLVLFCVITTPAFAQKAQSTIAAVVNNQAVTRADLDDRMKLIMTSAGMPNDPVLIAKIAPQILDTLIEEKIKRQEADRLKITIEDADVAKAIEDIAGQNKMTSDQFLKMMQARGISVKTLKDQIRTQILWMRVVARVIRPKIEISETDIDAEIENLSAKIGQDEFLLSTILLPKPTAAQEKDEMDFANRLVAEARKDGAKFPGMARQFSRAAGANAGGDMGWVAPSQLGPDVADALSTAQKSDVIGPIETAAGVEIFYVRDRRARTEKDIPSRDAVGYRLGMERLDRMQRRYYLDLRSTAFVEKRI